MGERKPMNFTRINLATLATLSLGALTTVAAFVHAGGFSGLLNGFTLFALLPYVLFCGACFKSRIGGGPASSKSGAGDKVTVDLEVNC
jgi:hypothetical protein